MKLNIVSGKDMCNYQYFEKGIRNFQSVDKNR